MIDIPVEYITADIVTIAIAIAISIALAYLLRPDLDDQQEIDTRPNTASNKGARIPWVAGRRLVEPVIGFVGDRLVAPVEIQSGSGGIFGTPAQTVTAYFEKAIHYINSDYITRIDQIYVGGKPVLDDPINRSFPSGSAFTFPQTIAQRATRLTTFRIYWGDDTQPVDPVVQAQFGIATTLPRIAFIVYDRMVLGTSPRWPTIEYDLSVHPESPDFCLPLGTRIGFGIDLDAWNPAYLVIRMLTAVYARGIGEDASIYDEQSFVEFGQICEDEGVGANFLAQHGLKVERAIAEIMQDFGFFLVECPNAVGTMALAIVPIRSVPVASIPVISDDVLAPPNTKIRTIMEEEARGRLIFVYKEATRKWQDEPIAFDDDARILNRKRPDDITVRMGSVTNRSVAGKVALRRQTQELAPKTTYSIKMGRGARNLFPGHAFVLAIPNAFGFDIFRVLTIDYGPDTPTVTVDVIVDYYSVVPGGWVPPGLEPPATSNLLDDLQFKPFELPYRIAVGDITIIIPRIRANTTVEAAFELVSRLGIDYDDLGVEAYASTGGTLSSFADELPHKWEYSLSQTGPRINIVGPDIAEVLDLISDEIGFHEGKQWLIVENEIMFVRRFVLFTGSIWEAQGVLRGRYGTPVSVHPPGAECYILDPRKIAAFISQNNFARGITVQIINQPFAGTDVIPFEDLTPEPLALAGHSVKPYPIDRFHCYSANGLQGKTSDKFNNDGADLIIYCTYGVRTGSNMNAYDESPYDVVVTPATLFDNGANIQLEFQKSDGGLYDPDDICGIPDGIPSLPVWTTVRTVVLSALAVNAGGYIEYIYTNADFLADGFTNGTGQGLLVCGFPDFRIVITHLENGQVGDPVIIYPRNVNAPQMIT